MKYFLTIGILIFSLLLASRGEKVEMMIEICDNAIDDDGDGAIDINDPDCECASEEPESLIPNPSFESQDCCPYGRSQLNCASDWIQASQPTTDYIHTCGFLGWDGIPAPLPYPDGDGIVGFRDGRSIMGGTEPNWKEYAGACLISPLEKGIEYTFEFYLGFVNQRISPPIEITFFGTTDCANLPFGQEDQFLGCPTNDPNGGWKYLNSNRVGGLHWRLTSLTITPEEDIHAIAIGPPCQRTTSNENLYYFFDNLVLAQSKYFSKTILETDNPCTEDFILEVTPAEEATYQWYKDGIALVGETNHFYQPKLTNGDYEVVEFIAGQCNRSKPNFYRVPVEINNYEQTICEGEEVAFGDINLSVSGMYRDTFLTNTLCDSIVLIDLTVLGQTKDTVRARIFEGDAFNLQEFYFEEAGEYDVALSSKEGCDSLIFLDLENYKVFIPNAFSPNEDGINDLFEIFVEEIDVNVASFQVFNRWGSRVFTYEEGVSEGVVFWDGSINGDKPEAGIYTYFIEFNVARSESKVIAGDVLILE